MSDADLLRDPDQLAQDARVLDAWADCVEAGGSSIDSIRRAAAALREVSAIYVVALEAAPATVFPVRTCAPELA